LTTVSFVPVWNRRRSPLASPCHAVERQNNPTREDSMTCRLPHLWTARLTLSVAVFLLVLLGGPALRPADAQAPPAGAPKKGGILRIAMIGESPSLDPHMTTATITREIGAQIFETLYTLDGRFDPVPLLAEGHEVLDGGKRYVIRLRRGVRFHNGKELEAADVVASLRRWGAVSSTGKTVFKGVEAVEAKGPSTVEIRLKESSVILPVVLGAIGPFAAIYPKEVVDAAGEGPLKELVGTGPFRLVEHRPDRHVKLVRFDGYVSRLEAPSGLAGQRTAYLDELQFLPVPEEATRYAGSRRPSTTTRSSSGPITTRRSDPGAGWCQSSSSPTAGPSWSST
jgi:peptide/nickel transport system substrate-binding protein